MFNALEMPIALISDLITAYSIHALSNSHVHMC